MTIIVDQGGAIPLIDEELAESIANWLDRSDLTSLIPQFVMLAESDIAIDLRLRDMVVVGTLTTVADQDYVALPDDWLEFVYVKYDGDPLEYVAPDRLRAANLSTGTLKRYAIEGNRIWLNPTPADVVTLDVSYYERVPTLTEVTSNWLLTKYQQIYLYGALVHGFRYLKNDARADYFKNLYFEAITRAQGFDKRSLSSGSPLTVRAR